MSDHRIQNLDLAVPNYLATLVPYPPGKPLEELEREYGVRNPVKLASNENPLGPSPMAQNALKDAVSSLHRYPDGSAYYLKESLSARLGVSQREIVLGNGSNELIDFLIRVFVRPGDDVMTSDPSFLVYRKMVQAAGGTNIVVPLRENRHDLRGYLSRLTDSTRLIFLDNPNNPTGSVIEKTDFDAFLSELPDHLLVVLDEAYFEFVRSNSTPRGIDYMKKDRRVVALRTFSKAYGLSGLRVGYGVMDQEVAQFLERVRQPFNVNSMAQVGALAALDDAEHLSRTLELTWKGMEQLRQGLTAMGCTVLESQTNFILVDVGRDASRLYDAMLHEGVIVRAMNAYGFPCHIRITVGLPEENERCLEALARVLARAD